MIRIGYITIVICCIAALTLRRERVFVVTILGVEYREGRATYSGKATTDVWVKPQGL